MTETGGGHSRPRATKKSRRAFRTISEVASELDLPQHVLRFWETKFNAIKPMKRGGGRRFYRPGDVALLKQIRSLLYDDGYTIKGVQKLLREGGGKIASAPASTEPAGAPTEPAGAPAVSGQREDGMKAELQSILNELEDIRALLPGAGA